MANDKLVRPRRELTGAGEIFLTASQQTLAVQMQVTALNAKTELASELSAEFDRAFSSEPPEAIAYAFRVWRDISPFFPAIFNIRQEISAWHRIDEDLARQRQEKAESEKIKKARASGKLVSYTDVLKKFKEIAGNAPNRTGMASVAEAASTLGATDTEITKRRENQKGNA